MKLTKRQSEVLCFIGNYIQLNGISPTVREISMAAGMVSHSVACRLVRALEGKGYLNTIKNKRRSISINPIEGIIAIDSVSFSTPPNELTKTIANDIFECRDGDLYWKVNRGKTRAGSKAGTINRRGYVQVMYQKRNYLGHRIIFLMHHGYMPPEIDHIDGDPRNNRIENLREATHEQNIANIGIRKSNTSGIKNVHYNKAERKWIASVRFKGKHHFGGGFANASDAEDAAKKLRIKLHKEFANHGI